MADVRALLRSEQRIRRLAHPDLTYTPAGALQCRPCNILIKTESLWELHLNSALHKNAKQREGRTGETTKTASESKKRKADDETSTFNTVERKKTKPLAQASSKGHSDIDNPKGKALAPREGIGSEGKGHDAGADKGDELAITPRNDDLTKAKATVDEDQWTAFEKDLASLEQEPVAEYTGATISAPAMTNAEAQARSKEEEALQRTDDRAVQADGEKEDALRQLEDEFEAMEAYESRAKMLREKREALRKHAENTEQISAGVKERAPSLPFPTHSTEIQSDDSEDDDEDTWDEWRLGPRR